MFVRPHVYVGASEYDSIFSHVSSISFWDTMVPNIE